MAILLKSRKWSFSSDCIPTVIVRSDHSIILENINKSIYLYTRYEKTILQLKNLFIFYIFVTYNNVVRFNRHIYGLQNIFSYINVKSYTPVLCTEDSDTGVFLCTEDSSGESEGSTGGFPSATPVENSTGSHSTGPQYNPGTGKFPEHNENSKHKEFSKLRNKFPNSRKKFSKPPE